MQISQELSALHKVMCMCVHVCNEIHPSFSSVAMQGIDTHIS